ncbi:tRNA isopentenyl-2-thiomethyl-A-37 hydroxylase MiaE [Shewanella gelidii]|uniref:tRNA-(Ms[2]io[6]A)-hydroxylase n=1 Tax=Shewanella gelidii TaxID=1642821 RepID=A0A917JNK5_9GAMM|nr:tRNA isopentenyl-2-thiomethyl-A-37 hydroxylase MiaE [Shewanella gelidii]MCL1097435.1 tRNA isopentenyl-2-thiomethyl-A-37 hydroxylase MiaE [Shewanella gelidii]GGI75149.1 tRNA-(ms[2]io[6]A)-hydroxylase [Shewanella gelidii]
MDQLLSPILDFLKCETPEAWVEEARRSERLNLLLVDHCNCELKAAQTALLLMRKYAVDESSQAELVAWAKPYERFIYDKSRDQSNFLAQMARQHSFAGRLKPKAGVQFGDVLIEKMVRLVKEEFHHFYQVLEIMQSRDMAYQNIRSGHYAKGLMKHVRTFEPAALIDKLIIGALIEARSCERFAKIAPFLPEDLTRFYISLLRSESRHFQDYIALAEQVAGCDIGERVTYFATLEADLILAPDDEFRFHSGTPHV